ncbi:methylated-DNA-[protein]-cysteine S-methyltransferase Ogt [Acetobacterium woodii DSM 1030]|uniref:Methylated-DNA--protein-cysteine methyltransferase n=2 Tax=Acetobacterium woodii TaxID=33952 RepID=H6LHS5_ACEWD|nr:methylated-DNA-[protein]-cysteine S-methyltransferase Ogt [Acetobacterium woodii DSM 1030]
METKCWGQVWFYDQINDKMEENMEHGYCYETQLGKIVLTENGKAITRLIFSEVLPEGVIDQETPLLKKASQQLDEYFSGQRQSFDLPLQPQGTDFQQKVWKALQDIPYGEVCSYKAIAQAIGNEKACRAVGGANNRNPISIIIPCHRVIGANGDLVGYGGGIELKKQLLALEKK